MSWVAKRSIMTTYTYLQNLKLKINAAITKRKFFEIVYSTKQAFYEITKNVLSSSGPDDDLGPHRRNPNFNARVSIFSQLSGQNLVQFREEHSVSYEL